jgi:hypothetical protein
LGGRSGDPPGAIRQYKQNLWKVGRMIKPTLKCSIYDLTQPRLLARSLQFGCGLLLVYLIFSPLKSSASDPLRYRGGLRNSPDARKLKPQQLETIIKSLREKTGFVEIGFDEHGFLRLGDPANYVGGSATARALIKAATETENAIDLEAHNHSSLVAFARLAKATIYQSRATGASINVYPIEVDFSDFSKLRGDKKVIAAFDVGFVILHELGHAVLGLQDADDETQGPGECEDYINRIRRELKLPERQNYVARTYSAAVTNMLRSVQRAELFFTHQGEAQADVKPQKFSLSWEAALVGPIREHLPALAKGRGNKPVTASINGQ